MTKLNNNDNDLNNALDLNNLNLNNPLDLNNLNLINALYLNNLNLNNSLDLNNAHFLNIKCIFTQYLFKNTLFGHRLYLIWENMSYYNGQDKSQQKRT